MELSELMKQRCLVPGENIGGIGGQVSLFGGYAALTNSIIQGTDSKTKYVGGITGANYSSLENCLVSCCDIRSLGSNVGGVVGRTGMKIIGLLRRRDSSLWWIPRWLVTRT